MQSNLAIASNPFMGMFDHRSRFELDLSNKTLAEVIEAYADFKKKTHPHYYVGSLLYNLQRVEILSGHRLMPYDITDIFYSTFSAWLTNNGVRYTSQKTYLSQIKAALNWSIRHNCKVSSTYDQVELPQGSICTIALSPDEISHIAHFDINTIKCRSDHKRTLEKVRDHFVLSCNLGQRFSDMVRITPENFNRNIYSCTQKKTGNKARLDIDRYSITPAITYKILEKYGYYAPWNGDISNYEHYLHELIRLIGGEFNSDIKIESKINGNMIVEYRKKWEMVGSHTGRRSFVTYNASRQVPISEIMRATGHKSMGSFSQYIKFGD